MTVKELINLLTTMPQDALVVTEVYATGFNTIKTASVIPVKENPKEGFPRGEYVDASSELMSEILLYEGIDLTDIETKDAVRLHLYTDDEK